MSALTVFTNKLGLEMYELNEPHGVSWEALTPAMRERYTQGVTAVVVALAHMKPQDSVAILLAGRRSWQKEEED